jgi:alkylation response protein AidB-like acyl-CoA dehydrogenase
MPIDFSVEPEFQESLDWVRDFVRDEIEPIDVLVPDSGLPYEKSHPLQDAVIRPLQKRVQERGLWACHLPPSLGGMGLGNTKLALLNEILGRSLWAPSVFGCQAPDSGNAEILAHFGTDEQKATYLQPLLDGLISSTYAMTEPQAGADPGEFTCRAVRDGDEWVIDGEKWFASNYPYASFLIVMVITDPSYCASRLVDAARPEGHGPGSGAHGRLTKPARITAISLAGVSSAANLLGTEVQGCGGADRLGGGVCIMRRAWWEPASVRSTSCASER